MLVMSGIVLPLPKISMHFGQHSRVIVTDKNFLFMRPQVLDATRVSARDPLKAAASQIQTWVARFKSQGLDGVLTNRHARPRIGIGLNQLIPLIKSIENGLIHDGQGVRHFLRQRPHARRLTLTTAERIFRNWKRLDSLPLPTRVMNFLVNYGFIHRFATVHHPEVIKALSQLPAGL